MTVKTRLENLAARAGVDQPLEAILTLVHKLHSESGIAGPPFFPERFCDMTSVEIDKVHLEDCDARLLPVRGGYIAEVQKSHRRTRQNFSICHEIGHTFFSSADKDGSLETITCSELYSCPYSGEERLCNQAAAELLMPKICFATILPEFKRSLDSILELSKTFDTSLHATAVRIIELDLWPLTYVTIKPVVVADMPLRFEIANWRASAAAQRHTLSTRELVSVLDYKLLTRFDDRLGLEETLETGRQTTGKISNRHNASSMQFHRIFQSGRPLIVGFAFHST